MDYSFWDSLFNLVLLIFWLRIWTQGDKSLLSNKYLMPLTRASDSILGFFKPVFGNASMPLVAIVSLIFLAVFRAFTVPPNALWILQMGFATAQVNAQSLTSCLAFSFASFCLFLFKIWGLTLIYVPTAPHSSFTETHSAIHILGKPFSILPAMLRPAALLLWGMLLAWLLSWVAAPPASATQPAAALIALPAAPVTKLIAMATLSIATWAELLNFLQSAMFFLIIGSWLSMMLGMPQTAQFCHEWIDSLLGPFKRYPVRIGMMDLTPIVFFFVLALAYNILRKFLLDIYIGVM